MLAHKCKMAALVLSGPHVLIEFMLKNSLFFEAKKKNKRIFDVTRQIIGASFL